MPIRSEAQARAELGELFPIFLTAVSAANSRMWKVLQEDMHCTSARSRANILCDWIGDALKKEMAGRPRVVNRDWYKTTSICVDQNWIIRPHKVDASARVAVNDTQACFDFVENNMNGATFPGFPEAATVLYLGHSENLANPHRPDVVLCAPDGAGDEPAWTISLGAAEEPMFAEVTPESPGPTETRVVPKSKPKKSGKQFEH